MSTWQSVGTVSAGRQNNFDLIRMIAASGVLVSHAFPISQGPAAVQPLERWLDGITLGTVCVIVFFVLSGFFITKSFDQGRDWRRFLRARAYRLFPALVTVLCVTVLVAGLFLTRSDAATFWRAAPAYILRHLTLVEPVYGLPGTFVDNPYGQPINGSLWTLFYEVLCYAAVFVAGIAGLLRRGPAAVAALVVLAAASVADEALDLPARLSNLADLALPFGLGGAIYLWRDRIPLSPLIAVGLAGLAGLAHGTAAFPLALTLALGYGAVLAGFVRWRPLLGYNRLGDYSYGTYIFAFPIQQILAATGVADPLTNMALALPATCACAVLSWHLVEAPALARVRHHG